MAACPLDLQRKFERKMDERKTIQLSPAELDLMVECGAYDAIVNAAVESRKAQVRDRNAPDAKSKG
jgi:hypothetical protein